MDGAGGGAQAPPPPPPTENSKPTRVQRAPLWQAPCAPSMTSCQHHPLCLRLGLCPQASVDLGDLSQCTRIGTFFWMAPEVLTGEGHRWEADIWSVGCTLMEMLTARRPFSWCCVVQTQLVSTLTDIHGLHPPLPSSITDEQCIHFLQLCLVKARTLRPPVPMLQQHRFLKQAEGCLHDIE